MEVKDFIEIQNQMMNILAECEVLQRKIYFLNHTYLLEFREYLEQNLYLQFENQAILKAIEMKVSQQPLEEIKNYLDQVKQNFSNRLEQFQFQYQQALELQRRCKNYHQKDMARLDEEFQQYCRVYHPILKMKSTALEQLTYNSLASVYREGNITTFHSLLKECKERMTPVQIAASDYDAVAQWYEDNIRKLTISMDEQKKKMPLIIEDIFTDDAKMTNEHAQIREKNYNYRMINMNLHKDFIIHFDFDFNIK